jgi:hypothetical protein
LILDNADDTDIFFSRSARQHTSQDSLLEPLASFLPQSRNRSILITSRNRLSAHRLSGSAEDILEVKRLNKVDSIYLLKSKTPASNTSYVNAKRLVKALDYIPLAITQAAGYISVKGTRMSISKYLELFNESESNQARLLQIEDVGDLTRDPGIPNSVIRTLQISLNQIRKDFIQAANLLSLICVLNRQRIPEYLL